MLEKNYGFMNVDLEDGSDKLLCSKGCGRVALTYHAYCKECKSQYDKAWNNANTGRYREYQQAWHKDYYKKFKGMYIYAIVDKDEQEPIYIGSSTSIYKRWQQHFNSKKGTTFAKWCHHNQINKHNYEMLVLDLSEYDIIDIEQILALEHELIYRNKDIVINQDYKLPLTPFEIDILEQVYAWIDIHHLEWELYQNVIERKKNTFQATTPESTF